MSAQIYRFYVGARIATNHRFTKKDEALLKKIVGEYFHGWTVQPGVGIWQGVEEETRIVSIWDEASNYVRPGRETFKKCTLRLKAELKQSSILVEAGGKARLC